MKSTPKFNWRTYAQIARPDHWIKNIFMIPGTLLALLLGGHFSDNVWLRFFVAALVLCLISSANYVINEYLDSESDRYHPMKSKRSGARGKLDIRYVALLYLGLTLAGLSLARTFGSMFFMTSIVFLFMGALYNVKPIRTKDRAYLDVLSEAINNPPAFFIGMVYRYWRCPAPIERALRLLDGGSFLDGDETLFRIQAIQ